jgi:SAM-dependent methyltransferase
VELDLRILDLEHTAPTEGIDGERFDLVVCFGVLHHVPGRAQRLALVDDLARCLAPSTASVREGRPDIPSPGWLAISRWMLHQQPHFERKCRDFDQLDPAPEADDLEPGDTLLGWQHDPDALRYLAFPDDEECALHDRRPGLELVDGYRSDGRSGEDNRYWVWRTLAGS